MSISSEGTLALGQRFLVLDICSRDSHAYMLMHLCTTEFTEILLIKFKNLEIILNAHEQMEFYEVVKMNDQHKLIS